jgi:hypothetical protein
MYCRLPLNKSNPLLLLILLSDLSLLLGLLLKRRTRHVVQSQDLLIWVLDKHVLALGLRHAHVDDSADDTPAVGEGEVHLRREVAGLPADDAEDHVAVVGLGVGTGDESGGC